MDNTVTKEEILEYHGLCTNVDVRRYIVLKELIISQMKKRVDRYREEKGRKSGQLSAKDIDIIYKLMEEFEK